MQTDVDKRTHAGLYLSIRSTSYIQKVLLESSFAFSTHQHSIRAARCWFLALFRRIFCVCARMRVRMYARAQESRERVRVRALVRGSSATHTSHRTTRQRAPAMIHQTHSSTRRPSLIAHFVPSYTFAASVYMCHVFA